MWLCRTRNPKASRANLENCFCTTDVFAYNPVSKLCPAMQKKRRPVILQQKQQVNKQEIHFWFSIFVWFWNLSCFQYFIIGNYLSDIFPKLKAIFNLRRWKAATNWIYTSILTFFISIFTEKFLIFVWGASNFFCLPLNKYGNWMSAHVTLHFNDALLFTRSE